MKAIRFALALTLACAAAPTVSAGCFGGLFHRHRTKVVYSTSCAGGACGTTIVNSSNFTIQALPPTTVYSTPALPSGQYVPVHALMPATMYYSGSTCVGGQCFAR